MMRHVIQAALFDLDGVVVFTDKYHYLGWKRLADEQGWAFDEELNHQLRGIPRMASLQVILDHNGVELSEAEKERLATLKNDTYKELLESISHDDCYPGAVDFLKRLRAEGVKLALCSSSKNAQTVLDKLGLADLFDAVVTGHDFKNAKPDPEVFLLGAERLGIPPFHCVVFEDAYSGVQAGLAARMKVIGVGSPEVLTNAPEVIQDYGTIDVESLLDTGRPERIPAEAWTVTQTKVRPHRTPYWETVFALTNGLLGERGAYEEEDDVLDGHAYPGTFVNGIYDYEPYHHIVSFPGYPQRRHSMLRMFDWRVVNLTVDGDRFSMFRGQLEDHRRQLDMRRGVLTRSFVWRSPKGTRVRVETTRLVSMARRHSAALRYTVTPLDGPAEIGLESMVRTELTSGEIGPGHVNAIEGGVTDGVGHFVCRPSVADSQVAMAVAHRFAGGGSAREAFEYGTNRITGLFAGKVYAGETVTLEKHARFHSSIETPVDALLTSAQDGVVKAAADGFDALLAEHAAFWASYWDVADIEIDGPVADQQAVRFSMFHLRQSNPEDDHRSISACGMTGDHYWGHVFWDTEMYIAPHFLYTQPETVRPLLMYRYHLLDKARERAREMAGIGALFSWNSINGEECGVVYEASTAEYHLLSAVAYAIDKYVRATGDEAFLFDYGAEILFETSRFLSDRGRFIEARGGQFCINVVCGPDEYGCGISNNCYTNMLAQWHFRFAARVYDRMKAERGDAFARLVERIGLAADERALWERAADAMYIPYSEELGIHAQDDSFLYLDPVDMTKVPRFTDLRNQTHPLNLWRMQVAKQADVVLLMLVLGDQFTREQKRANYDYYEPRTNHGSSLSPSIHSIVAAEVGEPEDAYVFFRHSAGMDLDDFKDNTAGGVHSACLGGTWMAVVNGFAGMRDYEGGLVFDPMLPSAWRSYRFTLCYQGRRLGVSVDADGVVYRLIDGAGVRFESSGEMVELTAEKREVRAPLARR